MIDTGILVCLILSYPTFDLADRVLSTQEVLVFKLLRPPKIANQQLREMKWVGPDRIIFLVGNRWRCGDSEVCINPCEDSHPTNKMKKTLRLLCRLC